MQQQARELKLTYANIDWLTDWLTHWHMMLYVAGNDGASSSPPFALCRKRWRWPNKMKVKNCVHVNTSYISVMPRNRTTNRLAPPVTTSFRLTHSPPSCLLPAAFSNAFLTFYWLSRQLAAISGNWQLVTGNWQLATMHPPKCKYLTTFLCRPSCFYLFSFSLCVCVFYQYEILES